MINEENSETIQTEVCGPIESGGVGTDSSEARPEVCGGRENSKQNDANPGNGPSRQDEDFNSLLGPPLLLSGEDPRAYSQILATLSQDYPASSGVAGVRRLWEQETVASRILTVRRGTIAETYAWTAAIGDADLRRFSRAAAVGVKLGPPILEINADVDFAGLFETLKAIDGVTSPARADINRGFRALEKMQRRAENKTENSSSSQSPLQSGRQASTPPCGIDDEIKAENPPTVIAAKRDEAER
jgi:hypothetical protein